MLVQQNQTLLDVAVLNAGTVLSVFDYAFTNDISITGLLVPGQTINEVDKKEYERFEFYELIQKYIPKRADLITVIDNQSLMDVAVQTDGCVLMLFDYAFTNDISITDLIAPGQKLKMPNTEVYRYNDLANYFKANEIKIATYQPPLVDVLLDYLFPGEFPFSF